MPRYLHIPHTPDTARTLTLSGRNCLVVSGIVTPPKIGYRRGKGRRGEMCPQGTQKSHSGAAACLVAYLYVHVPHIALPDQPARILSTDKKAQKAGGLCLALKGVPVKPTDDVDVDKEYQLIPIDSL